MSEPDGARSGTQAVERSARLLQCLVESDRALSIGELSLATGLHQTTTSRLVGALERHGILAREGRRGPVRPGPALLRLAYSPFAQRRLVKIAEPVLYEVNAATRETVNLTTCVGNQLDHVSQVNSPYVVGLTNWLRRAVPLHCSSTGRVFLAFGEATLPPRPLERLNEFTVTDRKVLSEALETVRQQRCSITIDEFEVGLSGVAAPVFDAVGEVIAAISVSGPSIRLPYEVLESHGKLLLEAADRLSAELVNPKPGAVKAAHSYV